MNSLRMQSGKKRGARGVTLLETAVAAAILMFGIVGVASLFAVSSGKNKGSGEIATRTTEYAQDKMEQLLALSFADGATDTTVFPSNPLGGTGLGGAMAASTTVGSINLSSPLTGYVDYLDANGGLLTAVSGSNAQPANAFYTREWTVATDSTGTLKTITVVVTARSASGGGGIVPSTQLVSYKTN